MSKNFFQQALEATPKDIEIYVSKSVDVVERVMGILKAQGKTQKDLAKALGKSESEISKWLCGTHNLTLKTIAKIEAALGEDIVVVLPKPQSHSMHIRINRPKQKSDSGVRPFSNITPLGKRSKNKPVDITESYSHAS